MSKQNPNPNISDSYKLKSPSPDIPKFQGNSSKLCLTNVPDNERSPRKYWLANYQECLPPVISSSPFVPKALIELMMRRKKNSAIAEKFVSRRWFNHERPEPADEITNMEGALHTFVTPMALCMLHGDYHWGPGHRTRNFQTINGKQQARAVIISASIQPDFENTEVMVELCALKIVPIPGALPDNFTIPTIKEKQNPNVRRDYDYKLKAHIIYHLTIDKMLPRLDSVQPMSVAEAIEMIERCINKFAIADFQHTYVQINNHSKSVISLEILFNTAIHQFRNEFSALGAVAPQGYVYTFDPISIFAVEFGGDATLINRIYIAALEVLALENKTFPGMKVFAFNDYIDKKAVALVKEALKGHKDVQVVQKSALFNDDKGRGALGYRPLEATEDALLVLHNNSDAFGQNIETEGPFGSLDGAIGAASSAAASLLRKRRDLVQWLM